MTQFRRRKLLVEPGLQSHLMWRLVGYWAYCLLATSFMLVVWSIATEPWDSARSFVASLAPRFIPAALGTLLVTPLVIIDSLRWSNRVAGPLYRLRIAMQALAGGESVGPVHFREGDYWSDLAGQFNTISRRLQTLEAQERARQETLVDSFADFAETNSLVRSH